tara:strand:+ start:1463 stop:2470 length:1008 start_codon:yes stop_codon:yes gene_type:complete
MIGRATADLHLTERTAPFVWRALAQLREDEEERGGFTVIVGDVWEQADVLSTALLNRLRDELAQFAEKPVIIAGNHDQIGRKGQPDTRNGLEGLQDVAQVVSTPQWEPGLGLLMPYMDPAIFWEVMAEHAQIPLPGTGTPNVWWTHQGWKGTYMNAMRRDTTGLSLSKVTADLVISGHYHMPQNIAQVVYCGSPYEASFAEESQPKSYLIFDGDLEPERVYYADLGAPRHFTVYWDGERPPQEPEGLQTGDYVRVKTPLTRSAVQERRGELQDAGLDRASILAQPDVQRRQVVDDAARPREAAMQWVAGMCGPDEAQPSPAELTEYAEEVQLWSP